MDQDYKKFHLEVMPLSTAFKGIEEKSGVCRLALVSPSESEQQKQNMK